jgi:molybdopterin/thiamine biosynthesis adenylyltransferase
MHTEDLLQRDLNELTLHNRWPEHYERNQGPLRPEEQSRLLSSVVAVAGCGGLGGYVIECLLRMGIGELLVIDPGTFETSNLNRQLLCTRETLGLSKVNTVLGRARAINPNVRVRAFQTTVEQSFTLIQGKANLVVDCLDTPSDRIHLALNCSKANLPLVHGAVNGWYGQVGVQNAGSDLVQRLYLRRPAEEQAPSVLVPVVMAVGSIQAAETCKLLLGKQSQLHNRWLAVDLRTPTFECMDAP